MTPTNLSQYYTQKGQKLPTVSERAPTYEQYGLGKAGEYVGSAEQNIAFLNKLMAGEPTAAPAAAPATPTAAAPAYPGATMPKGELYRYKDTPEVYERIGEQVFHIPSPAAFESKYGAAGWGQVAERPEDYTKAISRLSGAGMDPTAAATMSAYQRGALDPEHERYLQPLSEKLPEELARAEEEAGVGKAKESITAVQGELTTIDEKIRDVEGKMARAEQAVTTSPYLTTSMISGKTAAIRREYGIQLSNLTKQRQIKANELGMATSELGRAESAKWKGFEALSQFAQRGYAEETGREAMPYWKQHLEYKQAAEKQEFERELALVRTKQGGASGEDDTVGWSKYAAELGLVGMGYGPAMKEYGEYETNRSQGLAAIKSGAITPEQYTSAMSELYPGKGEEIRTDLEAQEPSVLEKWMEGQMTQPAPLDWRKILPWKSPTEKAEGTGWMRAILPW